MATKVRTGGLCGREWERERRVLLGPEPVRVLGEKKILYVGSEGTGAALGPWDVEHVRWDGRHLYWWRP